MANELFFSSTFGEVIKKSREKLGITQAQLASKCGIGSIYISRMENSSEKIPSLKVCLRLAQFLKIQPEVLIQLAWYFKTPPEFRKFLEPDKRIDSLDESTVAVIKKYPGIRNLLTELAAADLDDVSVQKLLEISVRWFVKVLEILKERACSMV